MTHAASSTRFCPGTPESDELCVRIPSLSVCLSICNVLCPLISLEDLPACVEVTCLCEL